jgi:hypothetical protein
LAVTEERVLAAGLACVGVWWHVMARYAARSATARATARFRLAPSARVETFALVMVRVVATIFVVAGGFAALHG